jgi:hypothetical protein
VRAKDRDNRTRGNPGSHESANNNGSNHSAFDDGISRYYARVCGDNRISCDVAYSVNPSAFLFAKSSPEIFREKTFAVRMRIE